MINEGRRTGNLNHEVNTQEELVLIIFFFFIIADDPVFIFYFLYLENALLTYKSRSVFVDFDGERRERLGIRDREIRPSSLMT